MSDELVIPKLQRPQYETYPAATAALNFNGNGSVQNVSEKTVFIKPIEDVAETAQENADELGEFISKVCRDAVEKATADSLSAVNEKIQAFQTVSLQYVNQIETVARLKDEARVRQESLDDFSVRLASREAALNVAVANQTVSLRTLLAGSLITSSLVWIYTIYDPEPTRIAAACSCSLLMLGPLVALYWRKG